MWKKRFTQEISSEETEKIKANTDVAKVSKEVYW